MSLINNPTNNIRSQGGGGETIVNKSLETWTRPSGWLAMPTVLPSEEKIVLLVAVTDNAMSGSIAFKCPGGDFTVDWGDGSAPENFLAADKAQHIFNYANLAGTDYRGYRQALVTITPQALNNLDDFELRGWRHDDAGGDPSGEGVLEMKISMPNASVNNWLTIGNQTISTTHAHACEHVEIVAPTVMPQVEYMFGYMTGLKKVTFPANAVYSGANATGMFQYCYGLTEFPECDFSAVTTATNMFLHCESATSFPDYDFSNVTNFSSTWAYCENLRIPPNVDWSSASILTAAFSSSGIFEPPDMSTLNGANSPNFSSCFFNCYALRNVIPLDGFKEKPTQISAMYAGCRSLTGTMVVDYPNATNYGSYCYNCTGIDAVEIVSHAGVTSFNSLCRYNLRVTNVTITGDTSGVTDCAQMFRDNPNLREAPSFDTSGVTGCANMFDSCFTLTYVPDYNLSSCLYFEYMFSDCHSLVSIPDFGNTPLLQRVNYTFRDCYSLQEIPAWNLAGVTSASYTTQWCTGTRSIRRIKAYGCTQNLDQRNQSLGWEELNEIFTNLGTATGTKYVYVSGNFGTSDPSYDPTIATAKGWTVA